jgi:hypothetical protein
MSDAAYAQAFEPGAFSIPDFCRYAAVGRSKAYELIGEGAISTRKIGRKTVILRGEAERFLQNLPMSRDSERQAGLQHTAHRERREAMRQLDRLEAHCRQRSVGRIDRPVGQEMQPIRFGVPR